MSVSIKYKGVEIASADTDVTKTIQTRGEYCEDDIQVINTQDGGAEITDGIIIKSRDAQNFPTELDIYGNLWKNALSYEGQYYHNTIGWQKVTTINLRTNQTTLTHGCFFGMQSLASITGLDKITTIGAYCLCDTRIVNLNLPLVTRIDYEKPFATNPALTTVSIPNASGNLTAGTYELFGGCTGLQSVLLGSVGHGLKDNGSTQAFKGCTQSGLTITIFAKGADADALFNRIRIQATNATIIIKASEDTTYGGTSYAAGDTMIISEVA